MPMKKIYNWLIGIALFLVVTNPSMNDFKDFMGTGIAKLNGTDLSKRANYLIFSRYDDGMEKYIGILKNFYSIGDYDTIPETSKRDSLKTDSAKN